MKRTLFVLPLVLVLISFAAQSEQDSEIPSIIKADLDKRFAGWRHPNVNDEIRKFLREYAAADARPEFIKGDFDGNGKMDYAVLIDYESVHNEEGAAVARNMSIVAYLKQEEDFEFHMVATEAGGEYLQIMKKGGKDYDYETQKNFIYENDAIFAGIFEKAGTSYIYKDGKFVAILTSD